MNSSAGPASSLPELCALRARVGMLLKTHFDAIMQFAIDVSNREDGRRGRRQIRGFVHLASDKHVAGDQPDTTSRVSLASTATCVRSLRLCAERLWRQLDFSPLAEEVRRRHRDMRLLTTGLEHLNPFTIGQLVPVFGDIGVQRDEAVAQDSSRKLSEYLTIPGISLGGFPPNGYLSYWVLAAARAAAIRVPRNAPLVEWSRQEFNRHLALLSAGDDEEGDAFQLAYNLVIQAAFAPSGLRPSTVLHALAQLSAAQLPRGLWEKKEPLFVWEKRGDAYCFSFELLSTLLYEFRDRHDQLHPFDAALERSLEWAERNAHPDVRTEVSTWRSGHRTESKAPESWATAEVYAFLRRYEHYLDSRINATLLNKYRGRAHQTPEIDVFERFYQPEVRSRVTRMSKPLFGDVVRRNMLEPLRNRPEESEDYSLIRNSDPAHRLRSAILFGPPGTGKTSFVDAIARYLGWPVIVLDPSDFASEGLHLLPTTIGKIFADLREARDTVIFFDEMEELMRDRRSEEGGQGEPTFEQRLLTTALLPKLQDLHDQARSLFFVATNHYAAIDEAARRFGRFDLTIEVLPACFEEKRRQILDGVTEAQSDPEDETSQAFIAGVESDLQSLTTAERSEEREKLEWATFGETRDLISALLYAQRDSPGRGSLLRAIEYFHPSVRVDDWRDGYQFNRIGATT